MTRTIHCPVRIIGWNYREGDSLEWRPVFENPVPVGCHGRLAGMLDHPTALLRWSESQLIADIVVPESFLFDSDDLRADCIAERRPHPQTYLIDWRIIGSIDLWLRWE